MTREEGISKAKELGHNLGNDPPMFASVDRQTCKTCGRSIMLGSNHAYGSATETSCLDAQAENKRATERR